MVRVLRRWCILLAVVVACAACRLDANIEVSTARDGSGVVTITAVADRDMVGRAGLALADLRLDDVKKAGWSVEGPTDNGAGGRQLVLSKPFQTQLEADRILTELSGAAGPLHDFHLKQKREFAKITTTLTGELGLDGGAPGLGDDELVTLLGGRPVLEGMAGENLSDQLLVTVSLKAPGFAKGPAAGTGPMDGTSRTRVLLTSVERDAKASKARRLSYLSFVGVAATTWLSVLLYRRRKLAASRRQTVWRR